MAPERKGSHRRTVQGFLQRHQPRSRRTGRLEPQPRRRFPGILEPRVHSVEGPVQHLAQRRFARPQALCEESLYHGRLQGLAAALAPLCARRGRFRRLAAERVP